MEEEYMAIKLFNKDRDETLIQFDKEARKRKVRDFGYKVGQKVGEAVEWCKEHPAEAIAIGTTVVTGLYKGARLITRNREIRHEDYITNCRFYDRRHDEYVFSKRKLDNDEMLYLERKYKEGMSKRQVLTDLGLIKK